MGRYSAPLEIYNAFIGTAVIYGLLLALVIFFMFTRKCGFPYVHIGFVSLCGVITQASITVQMAITANYRKVSEFLITYLLFYSIQYLIMFLVPIYVAHQQSKQIENNKDKQKAARALAYIGYCLAFIAIVLLIIALIIFGNIGPYSSYQKAAAFNGLYLTYTLLHWAFVLLWLTIAIRLRKEISSIGSFFGFGFFLILMMISVTINVIGGGIQNSWATIDMFWVHFFLYHISCFIAILMASYSGTIWVQTRSVDNIKPSA